MLIEKTEVAISIVGAIKKIAIYSGGLEVIVVPCTTNLTEWIATECTEIS